MKKALIKGSDRLVSVRSLVREYGMNPQEKGIETVCPACSERVFHYGALSLKVSGRFHHFAGQDCELSNGRGVSWIRGSDWDFERGKRIRESLSRGDSLKMLYTFCNHLCGKKKRLSVEKFQELIDEADRRNMWCYKDIPLWSVPYLLLALKDFRGFGINSDKSFVFRFILQEKPPKNIKDVWESGKFHLLRVFDSGREMNFPEGNPYALTKENWVRYSKDFHWLGKPEYKNLLSALERAFSFQ